MSHPSNPNNPLELPQAVYESTAGDLLKAAKFVCNPDISNYQRIKRAAFIGIQTGITTVVGNGETNSLEARFAGGVASGEYAAKCSS